MNEKKIEPTQAMVDIVDLADKLMVVDTRDLLRYALNHPDAPGLFAGEDATDARPWEPLIESDQVCVGDEVKWDYYGLTMTATVARVDKTGSLYTAAGLHVGVRSVGTWHVRRVAPELPTKCGTVIVANDGHKFIKAEVDGIAHRAREAVLGANGWWYGAWRKAEGDGLLSAMFPEHISAPTWKVEGE